MSERYQSASRQYHGHFPLNVLTLRTRCCVLKISFGVELRLSRTDRKLLAMLEMGERYKVNGNANALVPENHVLLRILLNRLHIEVSAQTT